MNLSNAQLLTLKADINANSATLSAAIVQRNGPVIAAFYNANASPSWTVYKSLVTRNSVAMAINLQELNSLTTGDTTALQTMFQISESGFNPFMADRRAAFAAIFPSGTKPLSSAALIALWKRLATVGEKLFSTGTGSDASPATLAVTAGAILPTFAEGLITGQNVLDALDAQ